MADTEGKEASIVAAIKAGNRDAVKNFLENGDLVVNNFVSLKRRL